MDVYARLSWATSSCMRFNIPDSLDLRSVHSSAPLYKMQSARNQEWHHCLRLDSASTQHTACGNPGQWRTVSGWGETQSTGGSEAFQWWKACGVCEMYSNGFSGRMEKAISDRSIWKVHSNPKLIECQSKRKWNGGGGVTQTFLLVQWWEKGWMGLTNLTLHVSRENP